MNRAIKRRFFAWSLIALVVMGTFSIPLEKAHAQLEVAAITTVALAVGSIDDLKYLNPVNWFGMFLNLVFVPIAGGILWIAGVLLEAAIKFSINDLTQILNTQSVALGWQAVRDVCNLFFIFILIYIAIKTILGGGNFQTKQMLFETIKAAILINFSFYITRAIIDVSNIASVWFYNAILALNGNQSDLPVTIINLLSAGRLFTTASEKLGNTATSGFMLYMVASARAAVLLSTAYVFIRITWMLLGRAIAFIILAITSPIGFMGSAIPALKKEADEWWGELKNNAIMAPVFFLLLYITVMVAKAVQTTVVDTTSKLSLQGIDTSASSSLAGAFNFGDVLVLLVVQMLILKCLKVAKKYSSTMANMITDVIKSAVSIIVGSLLGVGVVGRVAGIAMKGSTGAALSGMAASNKTGVMGMVTRKFGTVGLQTLKATNESDFGTKANRGLFKSTTGFNMRNPLTVGLTDMGADSEKGYKGVVEARVKAAKDEAKLITGKDTAETLERQKSYANTEAKSIMNMAFLGFNKKAQAEVKKGVIEQAVKDNKDAIEKEYTEAEKDADGADKSATAGVKVEETKKELTTEQKTRIGIIDKEIVNQEARKGTIDPATGNFTDVTSVVDALKKEKDEINSNQTVKNDIKDAEKALEKGTLQMDKQLSQNLETLSATIGTAFTEKITGPLSEQLKTINKNLETATGDKKEALVKEKAEKEKEIEKRDKDFKDAKSILANIPESSAGAIMKQAVSDPRIMISLGARVRKNNLSEWSKKKADADKKRKEKLEDSQIKAGEELDNDKSDKKPAEEKPKKEPKPEGGGEEGAH